MSQHVVGSVRPSQLLWTYGPGSLIDLPNISVITMGLDRWNPMCVRLSTKRDCWPTSGESWGLKSSDCECPLS